MPPLRDRWLQTRTRDEFFQNIVRAYSEPHRHYPPAHNRAVVGSNPTGSTSSLVSRAW